VFADLIHEQDASTGCTEQPRAIIQVPVKAPFVWLKRADIAPSPPERSAVQINEFTFDCVEDRSNAQFGRAGEHRDD
jgi:hypothetical protein